jgi:hypothetical protein
MNTYTRYSQQAGITDSDVIDMRVLAVRDNLTAAAIAARYGIASTTAARIISGRTWSHVPAPKAINKSYIVYPDGRIFSKAANRFMTPIIAKDGLEYVELRANGERSKVSIAQLVAKAFLGTKSKKISFANGDATDSHFTNLVVTSKSKA